MKHYVLAAILLISVTITAFAQDFEVRGLKFKLLGKERVELAGGNVSGLLIVPEKVEFEGRKLIVSQIGERAFSGAKLDKVILPRTIKAIGKHAFSNSTVSSINFPFGLYLIGQGSFENTRLDSIYLPRTLCYHPHWRETGVEEFSFRGCKNLRVVEFDDAGHPEDGYNELLSDSQKKENEPIRVYAGAFDYCDNIEKVIYNGEAPIFDPYINGYQSKTFPEVVLESATLYCPAESIGRDRRFMADCAMDGFTTIKATPGSEERYKRHKAFKERLTFAMEKGSIDYVDGNFICRLKGNPEFFYQGDSTKIILNKKKKQEITCKFSQYAESFQKIDGSSIPGTEFDAIGNDDLSIIIFKCKTTHTSPSTGELQSTTQYCLLHNDKLYRIKDRFYSYLNKLFKIVKNTQNLTLKL